jgi:hypothetical protein
MLLLLAVSALISAIAYASTPERASAWRDRDIRIDGSDEEWRGQELPVRKEHFSLGIMNDGEWLYICLPTKDVGTKAQINSAGLVVWVDPEGGKKRRFGIHFPVPNPPQPGGMRRPPTRGVEGQPAHPAEGDPQVVPGQDVVGVLGPGKNDAKLIPLNEAGGIEARVGVHGDLAVFEAKLPLKSSAEHPYAPNVEPGQTVRFEIETAPLRGPMLPTGPYPRGVGIVIPIGRGRVGRYPVISEPFDVTMNLRLARGPL